MSTTLISAPDLPATESPPRDSEFPESDQLYEIVDGVRVEKIVSVYAIWIALEILDTLRPYAKIQGIGTAVTETVFIFDAKCNLRRRPDLALVLASKWPIGQLPPPTGDWELVPDIAVEVLSPNNKAEGLLAKLREYFQYGVIEMWIISPAERIVRVYRSRDNVTTFDVGQDLTSELVPGWSMPVEQIVPHVIENSVVKK